MPFNRRSVVRLSGVVPNKFVQTNFGTKTEPSVQVFSALLYYNNMYYVYAIKSMSRNYIYVGITNNIKRRLSDHNRGYNRTTNPYRPFELIYSEEFNTRQEAREKEKCFSNLHVVENSEKNS